MIVFSNAWFEIQRQIEGCFGKDGLFAVGWEEGSEGGAVYVSSNFRSNDVKVGEIRVTGSCLYWHERVS